MEGKKEKLFGYFLLEMAHFLSLQLMEWIMEVKETDDVSGVDILTLAYDLDGL